VLHCACDGRCGGPYVHRPMLSTFIPACAMTVVVDGADCPDDRHGRNRHSRGKSLLALLSAFGALLLLVVLVGDVCTPH